MAVTTGAAIAVTHDHRTIRAERESDDGLAREVWEFVADPGYGNAAPIAPLILDEYHAESRPSTRHKFRRATRGSWLRREPHYRYPQMPRADVPVPPEVVEAVLALARSLVTLKLTTEEDHR